MLTFKRKEPFIRLRLCEYSVKSIGLRWKVGSGATNLDAVAHRDPGSVFHRFRVLANICKRALIQTTSGRDGFMGRKRRSTFFSMSSNNIFGITLVLALLAPILIRSGPYDLEIFTVVWDASYMYGYNQWEFGLTLANNLTTTVLIALLRCGFAYQVKRYCEYKARLVPTLIMGCMVDCFFQEAYIVLALLTVYIPLPLPIPLMVVVAWLLMRRRPRTHDEQSWVEVDSAGSPETSVARFFSDIR